MASRPYSTTEAAAYLGIARSTLKTHLRSERVQQLGIGTLTSAGWIFTQDELDRLRAQIRPYRRRSSTN